MAYVAILGRQPALGVAELERVFGGKCVKPLCPEAVTVDCDILNIERFGGILKAGRIIIESDKTDWFKISEEIKEYFVGELSDMTSRKITLGISAYNFKVGPRDVQKLGIDLKRSLKKIGVNLRLIPNNESALSTATSHHNKLGLSANKIELLIIGSNKKTIIAVSTGSQNITAYAKRDQARPMRDSYVGMLPPKLAQIMINLAHIDPGGVVLDPFCGTGVILQEAALMGHLVYGTDISAKMINHSEKNLDWLADMKRQNIKYLLDEGDAMTKSWQQPINAVVSEVYLGQPFSAPPSSAKLREVMENCNHITHQFLINLRPQIASNTPLCIALPAWRDRDGRFSHLPIASSIAKLGYKPHEFHNVSANSLIYFREDQIVARELLVLTKI